MAGLGISPGRASVLQPALIGAIGKSDSTFPIRVCEIGSAPSIVHQFTRGNLGFGDSFELRETFPADASFVHSFSVDQATQSG